MGKSCFASFSNRNGRRRRNHNRLSAKRTRPGLPRQRRLHLQALTAVRTEELERRRVGGGFRSGGDRRLGDGGIGHRRFRLRRTGCWLFGLGQTGGLRSGGRTGDRRRRCRRRRRRHGRTAKDAEPLAGGNRFAARGAESVRRRRDPRAALRAKLGTGRKRRTAGRAKHGEMILFVVYGWNRRAWEPVFRNDSADRRVRIRTLHPCRNQPCAPRRFLVGARLRKRFLP